jgi:hypothetical protein
MTVIILGRAPPAPPVASDPNVMFVMITPDSLRPSQLS